MSQSPSGSASMAEMVELRIVDIVPYWRNPRRISDEAVNALVESIKQYGYQQPIVVDAENVIIMGHTRYSALRRMGVESITVVVARDLSPKKVKELRTIDNRTSEYTRWDFEKLVSELDGLDQLLMSEFFPEVIGPLDLGPITGDEAAANLLIDITNERAEDPIAEFVCPACFHQWEMPVSKQDVFSGHLHVKESVK